MELGWGKGSERQETQREKERAKVWKQIVVAPQILFICMGLCFNVIIPFCNNMIRVKGNPVTTVDQFED